MAVPNSESQLRYLLQWFQEWSELEREDFFQVLMECYANKSYMNGIVNSVANLNCRDKPLSIFACRIKLFREWFLQWNKEQKEIFLNRLAEVDTAFVAKLNEEIEKKCQVANEPSGSGPQDNNDSS